MTLQIPDFVLEKEKKHQATTPYNLAVNSQLIQQQVTICWEGSSSVVQAGIAETKVEPGLKGMVAVDGL